MRITSILPALIAGSTLAKNDNFLSDGFKRFDKKVLDEFANKNHVYSPMVIRVMATALMRGTSGSALKELADLFGFDVGDNLDEPKESGYLSYMNRTFTREKPNLQQSIIWSSEKYYNLQPEYRDDIRKKCGVQLKRMQTFVGKEGYLNRQVSEGTDGAINDFFKKGDMTEEVKMMILNSLKFDEKWHKTLAMEKGPKIKFYDLEKNVVDRNVETFKYDRKKKTKGQEHVINKKITYFMDPKTDVEYVWLPFQPNKNKQPQMIFAMPRFMNETVDEGDVDELLKDVDFTVARKFIQNRTVRQKVGKGEHYLDQLIIPKFKFKTNIPLTDVLRSLGVESIFDSAKAPFNRLFMNPVGLSLSQAVHQATIEVDETGAKATAVTVSTIESRMNKGPKKLELNRPFKFFITNKRMSDIYFTGVVHKP